ncbi:TIGR03088 family PEP-CTERM/XrtA system glycosyltransferase [Massilia sp. PWRC2]|uniref:TIGR03088 family PEP-CTERM/XrtA system glycosyltransferase n=1 Tax=Massilia sp. PWRC2 TaxID=2804626 RepID=UPI003CEF4DC3
MADVAVLDDPTVPLVVHLIYKLDFGGLENMLVQRINRMPATAYRHAVVALTDITDFANKISKPGVGLYALHKQPGSSPGTHLALWQLLRQLRPAVLHTYNLSAIEYAPAALLAGVPVRINGAHGRELSDPDGLNPRHKLLRRLMLPFYDCCYGNSADLVAWNRSVIGVPEHKSCLLGNGIDTDRFQPGPRAALLAASGFASDSMVIGTVGRVQAVKDHAGLVDAFIALRASMPAQAARLRLAVIGDGPHLAQLRAKVSAAGLDGQVWLPGARSDVAALLGGVDVFAMSSLAEGTPGSALEAMACSLPVVGTRVGGLPEVIDDGVSGLLVPPADPAAMAAALAHYVASAELARQHGAAGRQRVMRLYNLNAMVAAYQGLYDKLCERKTAFRKQEKSCVES